MILLSIIVPVYNVQDYVEECLSSIIDQIDFNIAELIIVNDGSTDESLNIIKNIINSIDENCKNIYLINQENKGLSAARNIGIAAAKGKYLSFIDSDDIVLEDFFRDILAILYVNTPDIIKFKFKTLRQSDSMEDHNFYLKHIGFYKVDNNLIIDLFNDSSWYAWSHVYKKDLFEHFLFPIGLNFEDVATIPYIYVKSESIYFIEEPLYGYRMREGSITSTVNPKVIDRNIKSLYIILHKLLDDSSRDERFFILYIYFIRVYFGFLLNHKNIFFVYKEWLIFRRKSKKVKLKNKYLFRSRKHFLYYTLYCYFGFLSNFMINFIIEIRNLYKRLLT